MHACRNFLLCLSLAGVSFTSGVSAPLSAVDFVVTRYDDPFPDARDPGDCSLRAAAIAADASPGLDRGLRIAGSQVEAIHVFATALTIENCEVANNSFNGSGAGVLSTGDGSVTVRDSALINNGKGLQSTGGSAELENVTFNSNNTNQIALQQGATLRPRPKHRRSGACTISP